MNEKQHNGLPPLLSVDNIAEGALHEMVQSAFGDMAKNIMDPNTSEKQKRKVTITFEATPYPDRSGFTYEVGTKTNFAGMKPARGTAYIAKKDGQYLVVGKNHKQLELEMDAALASASEASQKPV